ncbi:MAG: hypothetical protein KAR07_03095 [Spirochaetes bacterium]|nr:hypothetical protein [Spirochaetota bacterium]
MAKISTAERAKYQESIKDYKEKIEEIQSRVKVLEKDIKSKKDDNGKYRRVLVSNEYLKIVSLYCNMSDVSLDLLNIKNENYLNNARKFLYKVLIFLEEIVSPIIDLVLSEIDENLQGFEKMDPSRKLNLIRKIGYSISLIQDGFGENSKWKWSFVELEGRYATILKNMINYRGIMANNDPRKKYYVERQTLIKMVREQLERASKRYREKYELSTKEPDDMKKAINYQAALRRINILFNENDEAQQRKRTMELYKKQMEQEMKKKEAESKKAKHRKKR